MVRTIFLFFFVFLMVVACSPSNQNNSTDGDSDADRDGDQRGDSDDDADSPLTCTESSQCDDEIDCTQDLCAVGGVCRNEPLDDLCPADHRCVRGQGCLDIECEGPEDCDDGIFCTGVERCISQTCYPAEFERDCNDGDDCTNDYCNIATDRCVNEVLPDCSSDADVDSDSSPTEFDPEVHYSGNFRIFPVLSSSCGAATFNISTVSMSSTASELVITADAFPLSESPRPSDENFSTAYTQTNCGNYQLTGTFLSSDDFSGIWTASFFGGCGMCANQNTEVTGVRQP